MHTPDWRQCVGELCRVGAPAGHRRLSRPLDSVAAIQSVSRRLGAPPRARTSKPIACSPRRQIRRELRVRTASASRAIHRQFVLPIALHKRLGLARRHRAASRACWPSVGSAAAGRVARDGAGGAVKVLVTGATGFTGGHLARAPGTRAGTRSVRWCASRQPRGDLAAAGVELVQRRPRAPRGPRRRRAPASTSSTTSRRCIVRRACPRRPTAGERRVGRLARRARPPPAARGASSTAAPSASTATSSIRRPTKTRRFGPGDTYQVTKLEGERLAQAAADRTGIELVIVRPVAASTDRATAGS